MQILVRGISLTSIQLQVLLNATNLIISIELGYVFAHLRQL